MNEGVNALVGRKNYDIRQITRLFLEMRDDYNPQNDIAYDDPKCKEKYDALNAAIELINKPSMVVNGNTNDEVKRLVDALRNSYGYSSARDTDAADMLEKLAAENAELEKCRHECKIDCLLNKYDEMKADRDRWKARCEAAEMDIDDMIQEQGGNLDLCYWCAGDCASGKYPCGTNGAWRGPQEDEK